MGLLSLSNSVPPIPKARKLLPIRRRTAWRAFDTISSAFSGSFVASQPLAWCGVMIGSRLENVVKMTTVRAVFSPSWRTLLLIDIRHASQLSAWWSGVNWCRYGCCAKNASKYISDHTLRTSNPKLCYGAPRPYHGYEKHVSAPSIVWWMTNAEQIKSGVPLMKTYYNITDCYYWGHTYYRIGLSAAIGLLLLTSGGQVR